MTEALLPGLKTRKRRRRPPNERERQAIASLSFNAALGIAAFTAGVLLKHHWIPSILIFVVFWDRLWACWQPGCIVLNYLRNGFYDD